MKTKLSKKIKFFLKLVKPIDIHIDLFLIRLNIKLPGEYDWFHFSIYVFPFGFLITPCTGAGWGIYFHKYYISIHAKTVLILLEFGYNKSQWLRLKMHYKIAMANPQQMQRIQESMDELLNKLKKTEKVTL